MTRTYAISVKDTMNRAAKKRFVAVQYTTSDEYFNTKASVYHIQNNAELNKYIDEDIKFFEDDNIIVYNCKIRQATNEEIKHFVQYECNDDERTQIIYDLLNI